MRNLLTAAAAAAAATLAKRAREKAFITFSGDGGRNQILSSARKYNEIIAFRHGLIFLCFVWTWRIIREPPQKN
jgi:pyruvate kinase